MAEYRVEITIRETEEAVGFSLLSVLERSCPDAGTIMVQNTDQGTLEYVLATDAANAVEACAHIGRRFGQALASMGLDGAVIVSLHGDAVPANELAEFPRLDVQRA
jgi:hypothetical protein